MIDWPNLIAGFILGAALTLTLWLLDRRRARKSRQRETRDAWSGLAMEIELLLWQPQTTAHMIYTTYLRHPVDTWRLILGPDDFRALEEVQNSYSTVEHWAQEMTARPSEQTRIKLIEADKRRTEARVKFANISREMRASGYNETVDIEHRRQVRKDFVRHPIKTWRRERHNRRVHREANL